MVATHEPEDMTPKPREKALCAKTVISFALVEYPLPSYVQITCNDILKRNTSGSKWRNEAGQCSSYNGLTLVRCINKVFD